MAVSKQYIKDQLAKIGTFHKFMVGKELRALPQLINEGEEIKFLTSGFIRNGANATQNASKSKSKGRLKSVLVVATDRHLLVFDANLVYGDSLKQFPYDKINSVKHSTGLFFGTLMISTAGESGDDAVVEYMTKSDMRKMESVINDLMHKYKNLFGVEHTK